MVLYSENAIEKGNDHTYEYSENMDKELDRYERKFI